ncbi:hypothetical protein [Curtobacterium sp. MCBA15_008]|uniref:hypothetical protein n=1 Tax=Curtobacterium sp. MCBA15_008 TaxID=1898736 RepID=UPI0008DCD758|nr:hypothetical protein [Curtobacterium sp. MCBA15_008]OII13206.1 hypothetical protein BIU96_14635 [Curtobacterium sp. MCBA15_008]
MRSSHRLIARARSWFNALTWRLATKAGTLYLGAVSFIGLEAVAVLLTFTTAWPIALPVVVLVLGVAYLLRDRLVAMWRRIRRAHR